ncbi:NAD(P)-binding protein [Ascobolus immersus RN42]|uniref:NAD(P)-binding protein n=1 Tax=Ascobolus immersus RN42 TaxID=1160509 RepID=A0A3N4IAZ1_ASCIM|nr:NAD(P)-binding protein [Ascobolus immersus RN42]
MPYLPEDKPWYHAITIDLILRVLSHTFLNPIFACLAPLTMRAQNFHYEDPAMQVCMAYAVTLNLFWIAKQFNTRLAWGTKRSFDWSEEVVVITGGSSGLGLLMSQIYDMRGVTVAVLDKVPPEGEGRGVAWYKCDVGNKEEVYKVAQRVKEECGDPTILINNAAVAYGGSILDVPDEQVEDTMRSNVLGHFWTIKAFLPAMLKNNKGTIVTVSSVASVIAPAKTTAYSASKAAVRQLHDALAAELRGTDIKTLLVLPGQMSTPLFKGVKTPSAFFAPVLEAVDVAREVVGLVDAGRSGEWAGPAYVGWINWYTILPGAIKRLARSLSGADGGMETFVGRSGKKDE